MSGTTIVTVWTPRMVETAAILANHRRISGVERYCWLRNGNRDHGLDQMLSAAARKAPAPVTLLRCEHRLPIARAYNELLVIAGEAKETDILVLQDDVTAPPEICEALASSPYDLPAAWHDNRPHKVYLIRLFRYVTFMAAMLRARVIKDVGYLNELFVRGVDAEYGCRASAMGLSCGFVDAPAVHHQGRVTVGGDNGYTHALHQQAMAMVEFLHDHGLLAHRQTAGMNAAYGTKFWREEFS